MTTVYLRPPDYKYLYRKITTHRVTLLKKGDLLANDRDTFEAGDNNKMARQIAGIPNGYVVYDSLEYGHGK